MGGGGSNNQSASPYDFDQAQMQSFLRSGIGSKYSGQFNPAYAYSKVGDQIYAYDPKRTSNDNVNAVSEVGGRFADMMGPNMTQMFGDFDAWMKANAQTQTNWQNYADAANANQGGEGDQTITEGAAVGQRQQLLGAIGNPNAAPIPPSVALRLGSGKIPGGAK